MTMNLKEYLDKGLFTDIMASGFTEMDHMTVLQVKMENGNSIDIPSVAVVKLAKKIWLATRREDAWEAAWKARGLHDARMLDDMSEWLLAAAIRDEK